MLPHENGTAFHLFIIFIPPQLDSSYTNARSLQAQSQHDSLA
jgi:hypothetical protein